MTSIRILPDVPLNATWPQMQSEALMPTVVARVETLAEEPWCHPSKDMPTVVVPLYVPICSMFNSVISREGERISPDTARCLSESNVAHNAERCFRSNQLVGRGGCKICSGWSVIRHNGNRIILFSICSGPSVIKRKGESVPILKDVIPLTRTPTVVAQVNVPAAVQSEAL